MTKQPAGCLLLFGGILIWCGVLIGLGLLVFKIFGLCQNCDSELIAAICGGLGLLSSPIIIDLLHIVEIRLFCRRQGLRVLKVKMYRSHYGVEFIEDGEKKYGKWPDDFKKYVRTRDESE